MAGGFSGAIASLTAPQRAAMAWWVFFGQCECVDCCRMRHAWHAARLNPPRLPAPEPKPPEEGDKGEEGQG